MNETTLKIQSTTLVQKPLSLSQWQKKFKIGTRIERKQLEVDMYHRREYDQEMLCKFIKTGSFKQSLYDRIFKN